MGGVGGGGISDPAARRLAQALRSIADAPSPSPRELSEGAREELFLVARWFRRQPGERERTVPVGEYVRSLADAPGL